MSQYAVPVVWSAETRRTTRGTRSGWACRPPAPRSRPGSTRSSRRCGRRPPAGRGRMPRRTTCSTPSTTPRCSSSCARRTSAGLEGPYGDLVGQDRVVPYLFPTPAMTAGLPTPAGGVRARGGRSVRLRHHDAGRSRHLDGGACGCRRARRHAAALVSAGERAGVRAVPTAGPPRDAIGLRRLLLPQQRGRRRRDAASERRRAGRDRRRRRPPRQRHRGDLLRARRRALRVGARRPGRRLVPARVGYADETGAGDGAGATRNLPLAPGTGDEGWLAAVSRPRGVDERVAARRSSSRSVWTPRATTRRARCWSAGRATARPASCSAGTGLPAVVVQEGGYHLPTLGGLVAAYLAGAVSGG